MGRVGALKSSPYANGLLWLPQRSQQKQNLTFLCLLFIEIGAQTRHRSTPTFHRPLRGLHEVDATAQIGAFDAGISEDTASPNGQSTAAPIGLRSSPADHVELGRCANARRSFALCSVRVSSVIEELHARVIYGSHSDLALFFAVCKTRAKLCSAGSDEDILAWLQKNLHVIKVPAVSAMLQDLVGEPRGAPLACCGRWGASMAMGGVHRGRALGAALEAVTLTSA